MRREGACYYPRVAINKHGLLTLLKDLLSSVTHSVLCIRISCEVQWRALTFHVLSMRLKQLDVILCSHVACMTGT